MAIVQTIAATECIGNSLTKINSNFKNLNEGLIAIDRFRITTNNLGTNITGGSILKSQNGTLSAAVVGVDYSKGTSTLATGILKNTTTTGNLTIAVAGTDYYVPGSVLAANNTTVQGTLCATGECNFSNTTIVGTLSTTQKVVFGNTSGLKTNDTQSLVIGDLEITAGRLYGDVTGSVTTPSDINLKTNIAVIDYPLQKIDQLRGVTYDWISGETNDVGVIAQEVEKVLPQAIDNTGEHKLVHYSKLIPLLIEGIKELKKEIEDLRTELRSPARIREDRRTKL